MSDKNISWLYEELPELIEEGVLSQQTAQKLKDYYGPIDKKSNHQNLLLIFSILGAVLIGSGIILLLAHNWSELSRLSRTIVIFAGLIGAQSLVGWVLVKRKESIAWREGSSTFLVFIVGAAIALIGQTYNLPADLNNFLLTWMLLSLPLVYLVDVTIPAFIYLAGISWWSLIADGQLSLLVWLLLTLLGPYYINLLQENKASRRVSLLSGAFSLSILIGLFVTHDLYSQSEVLWRLIYLSYFAVLFLLGTRLQLQTKVLQGLGLSGSYVLIYQLGSLREVNQFLLKGLLAGDLVVYLLACLLIVLNGYLLFKARQDRLKYNFIIGVAPVIFLSSLLFSKLHSLNLILFNLYLLVVGLSILLSGLEQKKMKLANLGILMIAVQIVGRFFFLDVSFVWRGIVFVVVGIGFLITNLIISRQLGEE
jgi:uncharacterized membrane protein